MNWIPEIMKRAAKYNGELNHPEVVAYAHKMWQNAEPDWRYEVDGNIRFVNLDELARYLHVGKARISAFTSKQMDEFIIMGHQIKVNDVVYMRREHGLSVMS